MTPLANVPVPLADVSAITAPSGVLLSWTLGPNAATTAVRIERTGPNDRVFKVLGTRPATEGSVTDVSPPRVGTYLYRLTALEGTLAAVATLPVEAQVAVVPRRGSVGVGASILPEGLSPNAKLALGVALAAAVLGGLWYARSSQDDE